jgi:signal transduction histidine kinase
VPCRIVQEALTNALKHAGPAHATVRITRGPHKLAIEVSDDGRGASGAAAGGHGLVGMRERVAVYGGRLEAGPRAQGRGFALRVELPLEGAA